MKTNCLLLLLACFTQHFVCAQSAPGQEIQRLSKALQFRTVSNYDSSGFKKEEYISFINFLKEKFPLVHQHLERIIINNYSIVYHWQGKDASKKPLLFLAHYDVVPVDEKTLDHWQHLPFSGYIDNTWVWGRGAIDDKFQVLAYLEAVEKLLAENYPPKRSYWFAFGHDEEIGGLEGAKKIAEYFKSSKLEFELVLDEGGLIAKGLFPGVEKTIALIATAEKGDLNIELSVQEKGGHSSAPPKETNIEILSKAIVALNKNPMPARLQQPTVEMLQTLSKYLDGKTRFSIRNRWLFRKKILKKLSSNYGTNALIRSVMSPTIISGGFKENTLPGLATANINARILQGDNMESVLEHVREVIHDERVMIRAKEPSHNASAITPTQSKGFRLLHQAITEFYEDVIVAPFVAPGTTDSRHYSDLTKTNLRFIPVIIDHNNKEQVHGINERIAIDQYLEAIEFYKVLFKKLDSEF